MYMADS